MGNFVTIGKRLKEERERLGFNQTDFAAIGGIGRKSQFNYEADERSADTEYMAAIASAGADVLYILTGNRSQPVQPTAELSPRQRTLLANYDAADEKGKRVIEGAAGLAAQSKLSRGKAA